MHPKQTLAVDQNPAYCDVDRTSRARALARLLFHAMLDAEDLDCDRAAEKLRDGIELIKRQFGLADDALLVASQAASGPGVKNTRNS
jgi:hypothetical protein